MMKTNSPTPHRKASHSATISEHIKGAIENGSLSAGTLLTEEKVAQFFGTSRTPARTALTQLLGDGVLCRLNRRGFVVGEEPTPKSTHPRLTREMLGLKDQATIEKPASTSLRISKDATRELFQALMFGKFRIHEQAAADYYQVSRTVVRELLSQLVERGLVRKNHKSHWTIGPLTSREVAQYFAIRGRLEPTALIESAPKVPRSEITQMSERLERAINAGDQLPTDLLEQLEIDIHTNLLNRGANQHLMRMVKQSQIALVVNSFFAETVGTLPFRPALREHAFILDFVARGAFDLAAQALEEHLRLSADRTRQRLMAISVLPQPVMPPFLTSQNP